MWCCVYCYYSIWSAHIIWLRPTGQSRFLDVLQTALTHWCNVFFFFTTRPTPLSQANGWELSEWGNADAQLPSNRRGLHHHSTKHTLLQSSTLAPGNNTLYLLRCVWNYRGCSVLWTVAHIPFGDASYWRRPLVSQSVQLIKTASS